MAKKSSEGILMGLDVINHIKSSDTEREVSFASIIDKKKDREKIRTVGQRYQKLYEDKNHRRIDSYHRQRVIVNILIKLHLQDLPKTTPDTYNYTTDYYITR